MTIFVSSLSEKLCPSEESNGIVLLSVGLNIVFEKSCSYLLFDTFPAGIRYKRNV